MHSKTIIKLFHQFKFLEIIKYVKIRKCISAENEILIWRVELIFKILYFNKLN